MLFFMHHSIVLVNAQNDAAYFKAVPFIRAAFQNRWGRGDILWR
jgi:hypothetical protein